MRPPFPEPPPARSLDAGQHSLSAKHDDLAVMNDRRTERPIAAAHLRHERGRVVIPPERLARGRLERLEHLAIADAMKKKHATLHDGHARHPGADVPLPDLPQPSRRPGIGQSLIGGRHASPQRPQNLRPVAGTGATHQREHHHGQCTASCNGRRPAALHDASLRMGAHADSLRHAHYGRFR